MERWSGKVAIVTGTSSGIGEAIAESFVKSGMLVVGLARRVERVQAKADALAKSGAKGKLHAVKCDITVEEDILKAFEWTTKNVGLVHVLVNNAGVACRTDLVSGSTENWRRVMDTNVMGLCIATREASKIMMAHNIDGHIVHINSIVGHSNMYLPKIGVYAASKHAVTNLSEMLRQELVAQKTKIKVTSISPGVVQTEILANPGEEMSEEMKAMFKNMPMLQSQDIADAVLYAVGTPQHVQVNELTIRPTGSPW